jgi:hypothetical protein
MLEEALSGIRVPLKRVCVGVLAASSISKRTLAKIKKEG